MGAAPSLTTTNGIWLCVLIQVYLGTGANVGGFQECLQFSGSAVLNPMAYINGLAEALVAKGGKIFEETRVKKPDNNKVTTMAGNQVSTILRLRSPGGLLLSLVPSPGPGAASGHSKCCHDALLSRLHFSSPVVTWVITSASSCFQLTWAVPISIRHSPLVGCSELHRHAQLASAFSISVFRVWVCTASPPAIGMVLLHPALCPVTNTKL